MVSLLAAVGAVVAAPPACAPAKELTVETVCQEAALSIANRTFVCTDDADLANARFDGFGSVARCRLTDGVPAGTETVGPGEAIVPYYRCGEALRGLPCPRVSAIGDDLGAWLREASACETLYCDPAKAGCEAPFAGTGAGGSGAGSGGAGGSGAGGSGAGGGAGGGSQTLGPPTTTAACAPVLDALRTIFERCGADPTTELANVDATYGCDAAADAAACTSQLGLFGGCAFPSVTVDGVLKTAGKCRAVLVAKDMP